MTATPPNKPRRGRPPRAIALPRQFVSRVTEGEFTAIGALVHRWTEEKQAEGLPLTGDNRTAWFRALIRKEAKAAGIAIMEPTVAPVTSVTPSGSEPAAPAAAATPPKSPRLTRREQ
jgi:hypothetical protein